MKPILNNHCSIAALLLIALTACDQNSSLKPSEPWAARVGSEYLLQSEVESSLPKGITLSDSLKMAEGLVDSWVKRQLLYNEAKEQLDTKEIEARVEEYRQKLLMFAYEKELQNNLLDTSVSDSTLMQLYDQHAKNFVLKKEIIKGLYIKVPEDAPKLSELKRWYRSQKEEDIEKIEKYSLQNTLVYEYFYDKWIDLDLLLENIPQKIENQRAFLRSNHYLEVNQNGYWYLLNIAEYLTQGAQQPFEYAKDQLKVIELSRRKEQMMEQIKSEMLKSALADKSVEINHTPVDTLEIEQPK